jgi:quercetin dioxygenase-like cupin family protein
MCGTECLRFISTPDVIVEEVPWGENEWFVQSPLTKSEHLMMVKVTMGPGQAHRFHYHPHFEEAIFFLEGTALQWVGKKSRLMKPGEVAHIPAGEIHGTYNTSNKLCVFLVALASAKFQEPMVVDICQEIPWREFMDPDCEFYYQR